MCGREELPAWMSLLGGGMQDTAFLSETEPVAEDLTTIVQDENCMGILFSQRVQ
jgi:hypothetical protein